MNATLPDGTRGTLVAAALLLITVILVGNFAVSPLLRSYVESDEEIEDLRRNVTRYRQLINEAPELRALEERIARARPLAPLVLKGDNHALAAAELQQQLQDLAKKNGVRVLSLRIRPPEAEGSLERVSVEARMQTETTGLRNLLFELETGKPYVFLQTLTVRSRPQRRRNTSKADLEARMVVYSMRAVANVAMGR